MLRRRLPVEVQVEFITSKGNKPLLTDAVESQAKSGHGIFDFSTWPPSRYGERLVPMNDVMEGLIKQNGAVNATVEYLGKINGTWVEVRPRLAARSRALFLASI